MLDVYVVLSCLTVVTVLLVAESWALRRLRRSVAQCIVVTGTRGKSSVVRLIAAGLLEGGVRTVFKTTGSAAVVGDPDGHEHPVVRRSIPTPLEQRGILRRAARWRASALVVEAMSIRPESLFAELRRILVPSIVVITNVRADHVADLPEPVEAFARAIPPSARVFFPASERAGLGAALALRDLCAEPVKSLTPDDVAAREFSYLEWPDNVALALAVCEHAGVPRARALEGMRASRPDVGALAAWQLRQAERTWIAVNGFAANDPESTLAALRRSLAAWGAPGQPVIGLLNLRRDRGDRTSQWFSALAENRALFDRLVLIGDVPRAATGTLRRAYGDVFSIIGTRRAETMMSELARLEPRGGLLFGFGNIGGLGIHLVRHWQREGEDA